MRQKSYEFSYCRKRVWVCGASKWLGLGCAQALLREGVNVLIMARGAEVLTSKATKLIADGARSVEAGVLFNVTDITTTDRLPCTMQGAATKTGQPQETVMDARRRNIPAQHFGTPEEFGAICAYAGGL